MDDKNLMTGKLARAARVIKGKVQIDFIPNLPDGQFEAMSLFMPVDMLYLRDGEDYRPATKDDQLTAGTAVAVDAMTIKLSVQRMIKMQQKFEESSK